MSLDDPLSRLVPPPLSEKTHDNAELHFIGNAILRPSMVTEVIPGNSGFVGVMPAPAREDHVHSMASSGGTAPPLSMDDAVAGILDVQYGGTGQNDLTAGTYIKGNGTGPVIEQATPIPVPDGGTGATFLASSYYLLGGGTGPITVTTGPQLSSYSPAWANLTVGNGVQEAYYWQFGKMLVFELLLSLGTTSSVSATGPIRVLIPGGNTARLVPVVASGTFRRASTAKSFPITAEVVTATNYVDLYYHGTGVVAGCVTREVSDSNSPFPWTTGDIIRLAVLTLII